MPKGSNPNSRANLKKNAFTAKVAREMGRKGAIASHAKQAAARTFREELKALLEVELKNANGEKVTTRQAISTALIKQAIGGNYKAFKEIRDTIGEKPIEQVETTIKEPRRFVVEIVKPKK